MMMFELSPGKIPCFFLTFLFLNLFVSADAYQGPLGVYTIDGVNIPYFGGVPYPVDAFNYKVNVGLTMQLGKRYKVR